MLSFLLSVLFTISRTLHVCVCGGVQADTADLEAALAAELHEAAEVAGEVAALEEAKAKSRSATSAVGGTTAALLDW